MPGRFTKPLSPMGKEWDAPTRARIYEQFRALGAGMSGLQGEPDTPTTIIAGDIVIPEPNQTPAPSNHTHPIETAAPSVKVAYAGSPLEGSSTSLIRSDAKHILADGVTPGDVLRWNGAEWISVPATSLPGYGMSMLLESGEDGEMGPPGRDGVAGTIGPTGPQGIAGISGAQGIDGADGEDGPMGPPGPAGSSGPSGSTGATGPMGPIGIGLDGSDGEDGPMGPPGIPGSTGSSGAAGATGPAGPPGIGLDGEDGEDGYPIPGPQGPPGSSGPGAGDIAMSLIAASVDETITAGYSAYVSDYYEIASTKFLEVGDGSVFEVG